MAAAAKRIKMTDVKPDRFGAELMAHSQRRFKVYRDEIKERHTSHWDWDYLQRSHLDELLREHDQSPPSKSQQRQDARPNVLRALVDWLFR